jgi:transposase-like protein
MKKTRRQHSAEFKSKVAIEALREQKTMSQICESYSLHANQISEWKKTMLEQGYQLFEKGADKRDLLSELDLDALQAPFLEQIGLLQMEMSYLKKKLKHLVPQ